MTSHIFAAHIKPFLPVSPLHLHIEALIFCAAQPVSVSDLQTALQELFEAELPVNEIEAALEDIRDKYAADAFAFEVVKAAGGFQFMTKPAFQHTVSIYLRQSSKKRLSKAALETLSIIAYRQPIAKSQIEQIRGVNCDYAVKKLLEKELIELQGKAETVGKPLLYGTTAKFLEYFGINDLSEMPQPKDFAEEEARIGEQEQPGE